MGFVFARLYKLLCTQTFLLFVLQYANTRKKVFSLASGGMAPHCMGTLHMHSEWATNAHASKVALELTLCQNFAVTWILGGSVETFFNRIGPCLLWLCIMNNDLDVSFWIFPKWNIITSDKWDKHWCCKKQKRQINYVLDGRYHICVVSSVFPYLDFIVELSFCILVCFSLVTIG
jgi:hypothetical protein